MRNRFTPTCVGKSAAMAAETLIRRFTPTCVGKSSRSRAVPAAQPVHPHVCGEIRCAIALVRSRRTVHPHVCGEIVSASAEPCTLRFTPTCVGKSVGSRTS